MSDQAVTTRAKVDAIRSESREALKRIREEREAARKNAARRWAPTRSTPVEAPPPPPATRSRKAKAATASAGPVAKKAETKPAKDMKSVTKTAVTTKTAEKAPSTSTPVSQPVRARRWQPTRTAMARSEAKTGPKSEFAVNPKSEARPAPQTALPADEPAVAKAADQAPPATPDSGTAAKPANEHQKPPTRRPMVPKPGTETRIAAAVLAATRENAEGAAHGTRPARPQRPARTRAPSLFQKKTPLDIVPLLGPSLRLRLDQAGIASAEELLSVEPATLIENLGEIAGLINIDGWLNAIKKVIDEQEKT